MLKGKNRGLCSIPLVEKVSVYHGCYGTECGEYGCDACVRAGSCIKEPDFRKLCS